MVAGFAGAALVAAGCGLTSSSSRTTTERVTVTRTVTRTVTTTPKLTQVSACRGADLTGTFSEVAGSGAAGSISYSLKLTNVASAACFVDGVPDVQLVSKAGDDLQTRAQAAEGDSPAKVSLAPGASAKAEARFSPTVAPCNPTPAATLHVTATGGGTVDVPVDPPTPVCNGGAMVWSGFTTAP